MHIIVSIMAALALLLAVASAVGAQTMNLTNVAVCNDQAHQQAGSPSALPGTKPRSLTPERGTTTDPSGSIVAESTDPLLQGMAADGLKDPAYRSAYRECMAGRSGKRP